jgi:hypothetical protein
MTPEDAGESSVTNAADATSRSRRPRVWLIIAAAFCIVGELANGLLNVLGVGTSRVVNVVSALALVAGFVIAIVKALGEDLTKASRRARGAFIAGVVLSSILLLVAGLATRVVAPLHRMPGTSDVAVIGIHAPTPEQQSEFNDVAASLAKVLPHAPDAEVHNYSGQVKAPLDQLRRSETSPELNRWLIDFLAKTDAELIIAGYASSGPGAQTSIQLLAFIPAELSTDAAELVGWYAFRTYRADRTLDSTRTRRALVDAMASEYSGLASFLQGLDAWQSGYAREAVTAFSDAINRQPTNRSTTLQDLARLFRGHALETQSQGANPRDRAELLLSARDDYTAIAASSPITVRARLSLATNQYLRASGAGCKPGSPTIRELVESSAVLAEIADNPGLPQLPRLRAKVNRAQVEHCLLNAGYAGASERLRPLLAELTAVPLPNEPDLRVGALRQIKALAFSIQAVLLAEGESFAEAVDSIANALELDPRYERQALWLGLKSIWLLRRCHLQEGAKAQQESLVQLEAAVTAERLPRSEIERYANAFSTDLEEARRRCGKE